MSAPNAFEFEETGMIELAVKQGDAPAARIDLDLYKANNQIADLQKKHPTDARSTAYVDELCALVASWGLPKPSQKLAVQITDRITAAVVDVEKKTAPEPPTTSLPGSPASTGSTVSDFPPDDSLP